MPRILLMLVLFFVRLGKGLLALKDELIIGILYMIVLAPAASVKKILPDRKRKFIARKSSWVNIEPRERP